MSWLNRPPAQGLIATGIIDPSAFATGPLDLILNVKRDFGASGSNASTTGMISASSPILTLAAALDFVNGQGISIANAGPLPTISAPTAATATPTGTAGTTTIEYGVSVLDGNGGVTASFAFSTTTANATLSATNYNALAVTAVAGAAGYAWWRKATNGTSPTTIGYIGSTAGPTLNDTGLAILTPPNGIPSAAPAVALGDLFVTSIKSGAGTLSLTLAAAATTAVTATAVNHDDTAAFSNALATGKTVLVPEGTYIIANGPITITSQGLIGAGAGVTTLINGSATSDLIYLYGQSARLADFTITSLAGQQTAGTYIKTYKAANEGAIYSAIDRVFLRDAFNGISINWGSEIWLTDMDIRNTYNYGIEIGAQSYVNDVYLNRIVADNPSLNGGAKTVANLYISAPTNGTSSTTVEGANGIWVSDCDFLHGYVNILVSAPQYSKIAWLFFSQVAGDTSTGTDNWQFTGLGLIEGVQMQGCWAGTAANCGLEIFTGNGVSIMGGQFSHNGASGILLQGATGSGTGAVNITIDGAIVSGNNTGSVSANGITIEQGPVSIRGCLIGEEEEFSATQIYGIQVTQNVKVDIGGNIFLANVTGPVNLVAGTTNVSTHNNIGYNPVGNITAPAVPASGTAYTNSFGYACRVYVTAGTVTAVAINGTATGAIAGEFTLAPGESITLTYTAAPTWVWFGL